MKKLSLKKLGLEVNNVLQREQLKAVFGGDYIGGGCDSDTCCGHGGRCVYDSSGLPPGVCV
jgi:hypothetical protein